MSEQQIFNLLIEFFEEDGWDFTWFEGSSAFILSYEGDHGHWSCIAHAIEAYDQFIFYSISPIHAPVTRRNALVEYLTRANYNLSYGNFELNYDDGEIRFRTSIDVEGDDLTHPLIRQVIYGNVVTFDHYFAGIQRVINGESPVTVIDSIESTFDDDDTDDDADDDDANTPDEFSP